MAIENTITTADYLPFESTMTKANNLLKNDKTKLIGIYTIVACNLGLRASDVLVLTWEQLRQSKIVLTEKKTNKTKEVTVNDRIHQLVDKESNNENGSPFITQKGSVITIQHLNVELKKHFKTKGLRISSHTMRKTFGRHVYKINNESEKSLMYLMGIFQHSSLTMTRNYLGITKEEIAQVYLNL